MDFLGAQYMRNDLVVLDDKRRLIGWTHCDGTAKTCPDPLPQLHDWLGTPRLGHCPPRLPDLAGCSLTRAMIYPLGTPR